MTEMIEREWRPVLDLFEGGYVAGFDRDAVYEFKRIGDEEISRFRMSDMHPAFNIAGLFWRAPVIDASLDQSIERRE